MKKRETLVFILFFSFVLLFTFAIAQEGEGDEDLIGDLEEEYGEDIDLSQDEGITPDSPFYFIDTFFDRFNSELENREEKIAEIRAMIEKGDIESAKEALERYRAFANSLEEEVSPEQREEARRSAAAIRNVLRELEDEIPEDERKDFVEDILEREEAIVTSVEIAHKIKELCTELAKIDPLEYSRVCKTEDDAPEWQKELDRDLTESQREEAKEFFETLSVCFEDPRDCECSEFSIEAFSEKCEEIIPLAIACDEGDEDACDAEGEVDIDPEELLPDYLLDVMEEVERQFSDSRYEHHAPDECVEAGADSRIECEKVMFKLHAPEECVEAFENGDIDFESERKAHEACEEILFYVHAPEECIDAGLTDHDECGKLLWDLEAPQECKDAGLTGEHHSDNRKCDELMHNLGEGFGHEGGFGVTCRDIRDPEERLACYDGALVGARDEGFGFEEDFGRGFPPECYDKFKRLDLDPRESPRKAREVCEEFMESRYEEERRDKEDYYERKKEICAEDGGWAVCEGDDCWCEYDDTYDKDKWEDKYWDETDFDDYLEEKEKICAEDGGWVECEGENCWCKYEEFYGDDYFEDKDDEWEEDWNEEEWEEDNYGDEDGYESDESRDEEAGDEDDEMNSIITGNVFLNYYYS